MNKRLYITLSLATLLCTSCAEKPTASNVEADRQAVEKVIEQYVSVINTCDTTLCGQIWSREDEVSFIAPSGHYTSYQAIRDSLVVGLFGTRFTQRELRKKSVRITINGNSAWSEFYWTLRRHENRWRTPSYARPRDPDFQEKPGRWIVEAGPYPLFIREIGIRSGPSPYRRTPSRPNSGSPCPGTWRWPRSRCWLGGNRGPRR